MEQRSWVLHLGDDRVDLDLDEDVGDEACDEVRRVRRTDRAEHFGVRADRSVPVRALREQDPRPDDVLGSCAEHLGRRNGLAEREQRLCVDVSRVHRDPVLDRRRAGHYDVRPAADGAGIAPELLEPAPLAVRLARVRHAGESMLTPMTEMQLYDLRVTVERIEGRSVCGLEVGDWFEVTESSRVRIPEGRHFCLYAIQAVLPLLPAKMRRLPAEDWLEQDNLVCCPDPDEGLVMRIERIGERTLRTEDLT
jgi:uncharacterized repeat protein (TIGR04076 family)